MPLPYLTARFKAIFAHGTAQAFRHPGLGEIRAKLVRGEYKGSEDLRDELLAFWDRAIAKHPDGSRLQKQAKFMRSFTAQKWGAKVSPVYYCFQQGCILEELHRGPCQIVAENKRKRSKPAHYTDVPTSHPRCATPAAPAAPAAATVPTASLVTDEQLKGALHARFVAVEATDPAVENEAWFKAQMQRAMHTDQFYNTSQVLLGELGAMNKRALTNKLAGMEALQAAKRQLAAAERDLADCGCDGARTVPVAYRDADVGFQKTIEQVLSMGLDASQVVAAVRGNLTKRDADAEAARAQHADKKRAYEDALAQARREARALL